MRNEDDDVEKRRKGRNVDFEAEAVRRWRLCLGRRNGRGGPKSKKRGGYGRGVEDPLR